MGRRRSRLVAVGVIGLVVATVVLVVTRLDDGSITSETSGPCTTDGATTSLPAVTATTTTTTPRPRSTPTPTTTTTVPTTARPPSPTPATVVRHGSTARPVVALTFDAGSDAGATSRILDLLEARDLTASFGLTGCWVERYPELARRIVTNGHGVVNHTQNHRSFTGFSTGTAPLTRGERQAELEDAEEVIRSVTGAQARPWFRPPYGDYDDSVLADVADAGYGYVIMWSIDSLGWQGLPPSDVAARTIAALEPGTIVLMHVGAASTDIDALPTVLDVLEQRGLEPVTVADLVGP